MNGMTEWGRIVSRLSAGILGIILLGAGVLKATDLPLFMMQMKAYGVISDPALLLAASWGMVVLQCTLGMALLLYYRPKWTLTITAFFWLVLLGGTIWAWATKATDQCGCYGSWLKNTPGEASIENAIFLALSIAAWFSAPVRSGKKVLPKIAVTTATLVAGLVLPLFFGVSVSEIIHPEYGMNKIDLGRVQAAGLETIDFRSGDYLVLLMATDCQHCLDLLPEFETLAGTSGLPRMVAFCLNSEDQRHQFIEEFEPSFPIGQIDDDLFWRLLGNGSIPRLLLVRQGRIEKTWEQTVPDPGMVLGD